MIEQIKREIKNAIEQQVRNATNMPNGMTSIRDEIKEKTRCFKMS